MKKTILILVFLIFSLSFLVHRSVAKWKPDVWLTNDPGWSEQPSVSVSGSNLHVVWQDTRYNVEIYYKCNPTGNTGIKIISTEIPCKYSLS